MQIVEHSIGVTTLELYTLSVKDILLRFMQEKIRDCQPIKENDIIRFTNSRKGCMEIIDVRNEQNDERGRFYFVAIFKNVNVPYCPRLIECRVELEKTHECLSF